MLLLLCATLFVFLIFLYVLSPRLPPRPVSLNGAHVVVTGGSSGIGKAIAIECVKRGAFITLVARNEQKLFDAKKEVEQHFMNEKQVVQCISLDVSKDFGQVKSVMKQAQEKLGPVDMLVNCAGISVSARFEDIKPEEFRRIMEVNYLGSVYSTMAVIPTMKERRHGRIVFVSSQAGQLGLFGYSAYSASKFALRGLSEALQMEVKPYNIYITVAYPPDTDTPGYQEELKSMLEETVLISKTSGLFQAPYVAQVIVRDAMVGKFSSSIGSDGYMLTAITCGMSPFTSIMEALLQVFSMGFLRFVSLFYLQSFDGIVQRCMFRRITEKRSETSLFGSSAGLEKKDH
uniref:3-ketodihydrosphingosine reductase n=1 Tax=Myxine glutinosa TaxID=7769 RepID=UPI00358E42C9